MTGKFLIFWAFWLSVAMFFGSIALVWVLIVRMPADYLTRDHLPEESFRFRHPVLRILLIVLKNVLGLVLVAGGVVMLFTPGQGILLICIGATLLDFPGKPLVIRRLLGRDGVLRAINKIRQKAGKPPLEPPHESES